MTMAPIFLTHPMTILCINISLGLISCDSCTKEGANFKLKGVNVTGSRYIINTLLLPYARSQLLHRRGSVCIRSSDLGLIPSWGMLKYFHSMTLIFEPVREISNNVVCATSKASDQPAHMRSLIRVFASRLSIL